MQATYWPGTKTEVKTDKVQPQRLMVHEDADSIITEVCSLAQIQAVCTGHNEHEAKPKWPSHRDVRLGENREKKKEKKKHEWGLP